MRFIFSVSCGVLLTGVSLDASIIQQATCMANFGDIGSSAYEKTFDQGPSCDVYAKSTQTYNVTDILASTSLIQSGSWMYTEVSAGYGSYNTQRFDVRGFPASYSASATVYGTAQTAGPEREGILVIDQARLPGSDLGGTLCIGSAFAGISDGTDTYLAINQGGKVGHGPTGALPFMLGVPFSYALHLDVHGESSIFSSVFEAGTFNFALEEADGTGVAIEDADPSVPGIPIGGLGVPEASTFGMGVTATLFGGLLFFIGRFRRQKHF